MFDTIFMKTINYIALVCLVLNYSIAPTLMAQTTWERVFTGAQGNSIKPTTDNNYVVTGFKYIDSATPNAGNQIILQKISPSGSLLWSQNIATNWAASTYTQGGDVVANTDGTYTGFGTVRLLNNNTPDYNNFYWYKTNTNGELQSWVSLGDSSTFKTPHTLLSLADGSYVALGEGRSGTDSNPIYQTYLIKTDNNGAILWQKNYAGKIGKAMVATADGGFVVVGSVQGIGAFQVWYQLFKVDAGGNLVWEVTGEGGSTGLDVQQTIDGGFITTGTKLTKHNATGAISWTQTRQGNAIVVNADGTFTTTTTEPNIVNGSPNLVVKRYTATGILSASNQIGPTGSDEVGYDIIAATDGVGYLAVGKSTANLNEQVYVVKTNASGSVSFMRPELTALNSVAPATVAPVSLVSVSCQVKNTGLVQAAASVLRCYLSTDNVLDNTDFLLGSANVNSLSAGGSATANLNLNIPNWAAGSYTLIFMADATRVVFEASESNNTTTRTIQISGAPAGSTLSDLSVLTATLSNNVAVAIGSTITASATVVNTGTGPALGSMLKVFLSTDNLYDANDVLLTQGNIPELLANQSATLSNLAFVVPANATLGTAYILFVADANAQITETNENNNIINQTITLISNTPDLIIQNPTAPTTANTGSNITLGCTVNNLSSQTAGASVLKYYLSTDNTYSANDVYLGMNNVAALNANASATFSLTVPIANNLVAGSYFLIYVADANNQVTEYNEANNIGTRAITINNGTALPDLVVQSPVAPASVVAGNNITVTCVVRNQGTSSSAVNNLKFYLSTDINYQTFDLYLGAFSTPVLSPGATVNVSKVLTIPSSTVNGNYYIIYRADADATIVENNENNNNSIRLISVSNGPDLIIQNQFAPTTAAIGSNISTSFRVRNQGIGSAGASMAKIYLSTDINFSANDALLDSVNVNTLVGSSFADLSKSVLIPSSTAAGTYYLIFRADANNQVNETSEANNNAIKTINIGNLPDLVPQNLTAPTSAILGTNISVGCRVSNTGTSNAGASVVKFYLSTNVTYDVLDTYLGMQNVSAINTGNNSTITQSITLPNTITAGNFYLVFRVDADVQVTELNEANNNSARSIAITNPPSTQPDLVFNHLNTLATIEAGASMFVDFDVTNQGTAASPATTVAYYLSIDNALDPSDAYLGATNIASIVATASSPVYNASINIPPDIAQGNYNLIFFIDANSSVYELNEANNINVKPLTIAGIAALPDFVITNPTAPTIAVIGNALTIGCSLSNIGTAAAGASKVKYYLSTDNTYNSNDTYIGIQTISSLANGSSSNLNQLFTIPSTLTEGNYFLIYVADANNEVLELNEANNNSNRPITLTNTLGTPIDLSLSITVAPSATVANNTAPFITLTIQNTSSTTATGIVVSFPKPANLAFISQNATNGNYDYWGDTWTIPTLAANQTATLQLALYSVNTSGSTLVFAQVQSADQPDSDSTPNNNASNTPFEDDETSITLTFVPAANSSKNTLNTQTAQARSYPNPATNQVFVAWFAPETNNTTLQLYHINGTLVDTQNMVAQKGTNQQTLQVGHLPKGMYFCVLIDEQNNTLLQQKIMVQ